jgi:hypothetical protein
MDVGDECQFSKKEKEKRRGGGRGKCPIAPLESFETFTTKNNYACHIVSMEIL